MAADVDLRLICVFTEASVGRTWWRLAAIAVAVSGRTLAVAEFFINQIGLWPWLSYLLTGLIQCALLLLVPFIGAMFFVWVERKVSARIQDRLGPTRTGGKFGWLQLLADGLKLITKEDLRPSGADSLLFLLAPYVSFVASYVTLIALPFSDGWVALHMNAGVFFIIAVLGLEIFGVILAGYASASKWSLFGAMREAAQVVSYEVPLGMCLVIPCVLAGSMDLIAIANKQGYIAGVQGGWFVDWYIFHDPFTFITFWVFFTCATASVNRAPFDLAEAESELVAGFHTEYSGFRWLAFYMAEYGSMFTVAGLGAILFFGGWNGPIPITHLLGMAYDPSATDWAFWGYVANLLGCVNFIGKCVIGVTVMIWVRWTLPRLRIDQVMQTCLKYCTPIAAVMFVGVVLWRYQFPEGVILKRTTGHVRESAFIRGQEPGGRSQKAAVSGAATGPLAQAEPTTGGAR